MTPLTWRPSFWLAAMFGRPSKPPADPDQDRPREPTQADVICGLLERARNRD